MNAADDQATFRSQDSGFETDASAAGHSQGRTSTISLMRPIQTPSPRQENRPTPLPSMAAPAANYESLPMTRQPIAESTAAMQPSTVQPSTDQSLRFSSAMDQRAAANRSAITLSPPSAENQNSIGFNVDQLREFMNQRSASSMSTGHVLAESQTRWDVLKSDTISGQSASGHSTASDPDPAQTASNDSGGIHIVPGIARQNPANANSRTDNPFRTVGNSREVPVSTTVLERALPLDANFNQSGIPVTEVSVEQPFPTANDVKTAANPLETAFEDAATALTPDIDDSMLVRLKGLYDPSEDGVARRIWNRQIPKLPNPWSVFRDREEPTEPTNTEQNQFVEVESTEQGFPPATEVVGRQPETIPQSASLLTQLVTEYENRLANWPKTPAERIEDPDQFRRLQQELRLLYLLQDRPEDAVSAIDSLSPAEQQFFQSLVMSLAEYRTAQVSDSPAAHYTGSVHQLRAAVQALSPLADLRIRRLEICSRIHSYGRIETFPSNDFDPGKPLLLYVELENFGTQLTASGRYLASFDATLQIVEKDKGLVKETIRLTDITDEATSERTDYFQSYDLTLPSHLMTGEYEIRLKVRDKFSGKTADKVVSFQVR